MHQHRDTYVWDEIGSPEELARRRMAAMDTFLADFAAGACDGRYVAASLPHLPFDANTFDLALCSHFLFTYSEHFSWEFHAASIEEMCRVARQVRVFPLVDTGSNPSAHVDPVRDSLQQHGYDVCIRTVPYMFQVGGDRMMVVSRPPGARCG